MREEEVLTIYRTVLEREVREGIPVTERFKMALFSFLSVKPLFTSAMFDPLLDPDGIGIDMCSNDDKRFFEQLDRFTNMMRLEPREDEDRFEMLLTKLRQENILMDLIGFSVTDRQYEVRMNEIASEMGVEFTTSAYAFPE
jgi:hypothetical protein